MTLVRPEITGRRAALACCAVALGLSWTVAALSDGALHDDDLTHFLYAKWASERPEYLVHEWGRPGFTVLYFLPAQLGWVAARGLSGLLTVLAAWLAYRIADRLHLPHAWLAAPLTLVQPMFFQLSTTTLTETPLAFYVALAVWLLLEKRHGASAAVLSLAFLTRHEAIVWLPIWLVAMWYERSRWWCYAWLIWAPLAHNLVAPSLLGKVPILMFLEPADDVQYGCGSAMAMVGRALLAYGPGLAALAGLGSVMICRLRRGWIVAAAVAAYFGCHAACRYLGVYATGGYARFLVPICPLMAVLALAALRGLADWSARRWWVRPTAVAAVFVLLWFAGEWEKPWWVYPPFMLAFRLATGGVVLATAATVWVRLRRDRLRWVRWVVPAGLVVMTLGQTAYLCRPWPMTSDQRSVAEVVDWLKRNGYGDRRVLSANIWVHYLWPMTAKPSEWPVSRQIAQAEPGTILIWDRRYAPSFPHRMALDAYKNAPDYKLLTQSSPSPGVFCYVFEKGTDPPTPGPPARGSR